MARGKFQAGFTLVELMIAVAISSIVLVAVASSFIGGMRILKTTFATVEMSLRTRDLRDRLLFHAAPPHDDVVWAGLLSGTNDTDVLEGNATKILMYGTALKDSGANTVNQTMQLVFSDYGAETCSFVSEDRYDERWPARWLHPGNMDFLADSANTQPLVWAKKSDGTTDRSRFYIHLTGRMDVAGIPVLHGERIVVPLFGKVQETRVDGRGGLDQ